VRHLVWVLALLCACPALAGELQPPKGWQAEIDGDVLTWTKPSARGDENVGIAFDRADAGPAMLESWFAAEIGKVVAYADVSNRAGITRKDTLLRDSFILKQDGMNLRTIVFAYATPRGKQSVMVAVPPDLPQTDAVLTEAVGIVEMAWTRRAAFVDGKLIADPPPRTNR
jgi:hypothetical protein